METNIRTLIKQYVASLQWKTALFWVDKLMTIGDATADDVLTYIRCLTALGEHLRALSFLERCGYLKRHKLFQYFGAQCLLACQHYDQAIELIESPTGATMTSGGDSTSRRSDAEQPELTAEDLATLQKHAVEWRVEAGLLLLLGIAYEQLENRQQAANAYRKCLQKDIYCVEALERLIARHMLTENEEAELLSRLCSTVSAEQTQAPSDDKRMAQLMEFLYKSKLAKRRLTLMHGNKALGIEPPKELARLSTNTSVIASRAESLYYQSNYRECYLLTTSILNTDEYHPEALPVHICALVALGKTSELFVIAHKIVDAFPNELVSWYAVSCYYYSIENYEMAKRFFHKCTLLDAQDGASWIGYGHSFAVEKEHDQAMNCYFKAAKVMNNSHLPLMYVGLEYSLTNNLRLAEKFLSEAASIAPNDPYVLHELGLLYFRMENYIRAEQTFQRAEQILGDGITREWEQLLNNLGHVMRKLKRHQEALDYHKMALRLAPQQASTLAAIGYSHMFLHQFELAVEYFHQSLSLKRDDPFVTSLLTRSMDILSEHARAPFPEPPTPPPAVRPRDVPTICIDTPYQNPQDLDQSMANASQSDVEMEI